MSEHTKGKIWGFRGRLLDKTGYILAGGKRGYIEEDADIERITALWNAADGMDNKTAVKALVNFEEIREASKEALYHKEEVIKILESQNEEMKEAIRAIAKHGRMGVAKTMCLDLLAKLEDK